MVDDERKVGGTSFQTRGPETAKLRDPYVIVIVLVLGTIIHVSMAPAGSFAKVSKFHTVPCLLVIPSFHFFHSFSLNSRHFCFAAAALCDCCIIIIIIMRNFLKWPK